MNRTAKRFTAAAIVLLIAPWMYQHVTIPRVAQSVRSGDGPFMPMLAARAPRVAERPRAAKPDEVKERVSLPAHSPAVAPRVRTMTVTAYCPCRKCCGPAARGITASGKRVSANGGRFAAAAPAVAFGTRISIPGYNRGRPVPVLDRGGKIVGNRMDVYFTSHQTARQWGVRRLDVTVY